jgi:hypothetical protein
VGQMGSIGENGGRAPHDRRGLERQHPYGRGVQWRARTTIRSHELRTCVFRYGD